MVTKKVVKKAKKDKWNCLNCSNPILEKDDQVIVTTSLKGKVVEEYFFHMECWKEYFNKAVTKKAKENVASVQEKVMGLMDNPIVKGMLSNVKVDGMQNLMSMLQMPLTEDAVEKVKDKIENDRKKAGKPKKRARKTQMH